MDPLCSYTLVAAAVNVLETFPRAILWRPLQFFRCIFNNVSTIKKAPSFQYWFQSREQVKISWSQVRRIWGILQCCHFFAKKSLAKTDRCAGALSRSRNQLLVLHFLGRFLLTASLRRRRMSLYINFPSAAIPVNYFSEFLELSEATM